MNYTEIVSALSLNTAIPSTEASFAAVLPSVFAYAEGRRLSQLWSEGWYAEADRHVA